MKVSQRKLEKLFNKHGLKSVEELSELLDKSVSVHFENLNLMAVVVALQTFIDNKGLTEESKDFVKDYIEKMQGEKA